MGARWYDPVVGRFLGVDPKGVSLSNYNSFNRYEYANNNPYKFVDPNGKASIDANLFIAGATIGIDNYTGQPMVLVRFGQTGVGLDYDFHSTFTHSDTKVGNLSTQYSMGHYEGYHVNLSLTLGFGFYTTSIPIVDSYKNFVELSMTNNNFYTIARCSESKPLPLINNDRPSIDTAQLELDGNKPDLIGFRIGTGAYLEFGDLISWHELFSQKSSSN